MFQRTAIKGLATPMQRQGRTFVAGGPGSGNYGHSGIPGHRGGSLPQGESGGDAKEKASNYWKDRKGQDNWYPASGGTEQPFKARSGVTLTYMYNPKLGQHAYYLHGEDRILTNEEAMEHLEPRYPEGKKENRVEIRHSEERWSPTGKEYKSRGGATLQEHRNSKTGETATYVKEYGKLMPTEQARKLENAPTQGELFPPPEKSEPETTRVRYAGKTVTVTPKLGKALRETNKVIREKQGASKPKSFSQRLQKTMSKHVARQRESQELFQKELARQKAIGAVPKDSKAISIMHMGGK